ncbi:response regulator [Magnetospirillum fulvum]|uniref:CheY-like receiver n=1 Tax=Magnetospirillum fulvum MGU-K5 TaxID=1316936 RepID=S9SDM9_MAGFU|nr:response regulator [Magnetospirillum fulvum]EPY02148.1 CheY-like receiver [Magnetospirillum fulvum MGU-K5]
MTDTHPRLPLSANDLVLVADDETFSRFMTIERFGQMGKPQILSARDGHEALEALNGSRATEIRVVVLDFNMPGANGIEVLKDIRSGKLAVPHDVIVMMITGIDILGIATAAMVLDVDLFLNKPTATADLRRHLIDLLGSERDCAPPAHYAGLDVDWLISGQVIDTTLSGGEDIPLDALSEGMVIASNLLDPHGGLLVAAGTRVTPRLRRLLRGLAAAGLPFEGLKVIRPI